MNCVLTVNNGDRADYAEHTTPDCPACGNGYVLHADGEWCCQDCGLVWEADDR